MKMRAVIALTCLPALVSAQPYSHSMAECAAIHQNAAQQMSSQERADKLAIVANQWADAAVTQAKVEGIRNPDEIIWEMIDTKTQEWEAKGLKAFLSQDFRDWTAYCRSFAKHTGVDITY